MAFKIDLSKFKRVHSDKDFTTMRHEEGHEIKVAHSALTHENRKAIQKLPLFSSGGEADDDQDARKQFSAGFNNSLGDGGRKPASAPTSTPTPTPAPNPSPTTTSSKPSSDNGGNSSRKIFSKGFNDSLGGQFAKGGEVKKEKDLDIEELETVEPKNPVKYETIKPKSPAEYEALAKGGKVQRFDNGGEAQKTDDSSASPPISININAASPPTSAAQVTPQGEVTDPSKDAAAAQQQPFSLNSMAPAINPTSGLPDIQDSNTIPSQPDKEPAQQAEPKRNNPITPTRAPSGELNQPDLSSPEAKASGPNILDAYEKERAARTNIGSAESSALGAQTGAQADYARDLANTNTLTQLKVKRIQEERDKVNKYIRENPVKANNFYESKTTPQKVATFIGLMLGGLGAPATGGRNLALDSLNKLIDNDIDAQKANLGRQHSLLSSLNDQFNDANASANMTKVFMLDHAQALAQSAGASASSLVAKQRADLLNAQLEQQIVPLVRQQSMFEAMQAQTASGKSPTPAMLDMLRIYDPTRAKEIESRYIPGVGVAQVPVSEKERTSLIDKKETWDSARQLREFATQNSGSLDPATIARGKAMATVLLNKYRTATDQGVIKPSELAFDAKIIDSDPTKFLNKYRTDPGYKTLEDQMSREYNDLARSKGLPHASPEQQSEAHLTPQQQSMLNAARANPSHPKAPMILNKLGFSK